MSVKQGLKWYKENKELFFCDTVMVPSAQSGHWIQGAIKNPGALRAEAARAGALTKRGTISIAWLKRAAQGGGKTAQRARFALQLRSFH